MDHFEVRRYVSIQRHLILICVSHLFLAEFRLGHGGKNEGLTNAQLRTATKALVSLWIRGRRCSRKRAETIAAQLTFTQERNAAARRSHRKRAIRRLRVFGIKRKDVPACHWPKNGVVVLVDQGAPRTINSANNARYE